jgi:alcohol dehydrogenase (cytochrome c)
MGCRRAGTAGPAAAPDTTLVGAEVRSNGALSTRAVSEGWYTEAQADAGATAFAANCATCHGPRLQGGAGPALVGAGFLTQWRTRTLSDLYSFVHTSMPLTKPGSLTNQQYADIAAFVLRSNGFVAGTTPLTAGSELSRVLQPSAAARDQQRRVHGLAPMATVAVRAAPTPVKQPTTATPAQGELEAADTARGSWLTYNKGYRGYRFAPISQVTPENVSQLRPLCMYQLGETGTFEGGLLMYDGLLYGSTMNTSFAIDAASCAERWKYTYAPSGATYNNTNRGMAIGGGRIFRGTIDGHVLALDAKTGGLLWDQDVTHGAAGQFITAAPLVWHDLVLVGRAGGDLATTGSIIGLSVSDGSQRWSFATVPSGSAVGAESWQIKGTSQYGGGAVWTSMSLDPLSGKLVSPVGNPAPDFNHLVRPGSNLFTGSVVTLDASTGALGWYNQLAPADFHDWDMSVVALVDRPEGGRYVAASGKNGVLSLLDLGTGKLVWQTPVTRREHTEDLITTAGLHYCPGTTGGVEWNGPGYSPRLDLLFIGSVDWCVKAILDSIAPTAQPGLPYTGLANSYGTFDPVSQARGWMTAVDAGTGKVRWQRQIATPMIAAITPTAGGVVFTGDVGGHFLAFDGASGHVLYTFFTGGSMGGGVISYEQGGRQLIAATSGNSSRTWFGTGSATVIIFGL